VVFFDGFFVVFLTSFFVAVLEDFFVLEVTIMVDEILPSFKPK
jgi:hypothetical protein